MADWGLRLVAFLQIRDIVSGEQSAATDVAPGDQQSVLSLVNKSDTISGWYLVNALYSLPFMLLAPLHGVLANALPKRWVLIASSGFCLAIVLFFVPTNGPWVWCLAFMALGSALYSAARYAILPAAANDTRMPLTRVNGWFEMGLAAGIVGGIIVALKLYAQGTAFPGILLVVVVLVGLNVTGLITVVPAQFASDLRRPERPVQAFVGFFRDCGRILSNRDAVGALLGMAFFQGLSVAGSGPVFDDLLSKEGGLELMMQGMTMACVGTALGSMLAGFQGNARRSLGLVPIGMTGMIVPLAWLALTNVTEVVPTVPCFLLGMMAGIINVPLRAAYQAAVPPDARGNAMSVMNFIMSFIIALLLGTMLLLNKIGFLRGPQQQLWCVTIAVAVLAALTWQLLLSHTFELLAEWAMWPMYRIRAHGPGAEIIPTHGPLLIIANHASHLDAFWIGKIVPRRVRPMISSRFYERPVMRWLIERVIGAIRVPEEGFKHETPELEDAVDILRKEGCVLMFPETTLQQPQDRMLRQFGQGVWHLLKAVPETTVVVMWIEGGWGSCASYKDGEPMQARKCDCWRQVNIAVSEPQRLDNQTLSDDRMTRRHLMHVCAEARRHVGLPPPEEPPLATSTDEPAEIEREARPM